VQLPPVVSRALDTIRPHPHRGDLIAAAAVPLTVAVALINVRFDDEWGRGVLFVLTLLTTLLILGMGFLAPLEIERPRAYHTVLLLAGLSLLAITLIRLAEVLGVDEPLDASGAVFWMSTVLAAVAALAAWELRSPICALVEFVAGGIAVLAFVDLVFDPDGPNTFRWILELLIVVYVVLHLQFRERWPRHAVHLVNAAGLAAIALALTFAGFLAVPIGGIESEAPGTGWELVIISAGFGLVGYAAVEREPGPGYLGFVALLLFVVLAGVPGDDGPSLVGWPLLLLLAGGAGIAAGLRPRRELPPEPAAHREPAPTETLPTQPLPPDEPPR
jgi:hypothetical protein